MQGEELFNTEKNQSGFLKEIKTSPKMSKSAAKFNEKKLNIIQPMIESMPVLDDNFNNYASADKSREPRGIHY